MSRALRVAIGGMALLLAAVAAWQIVATRVSDWLASTAPHRALAWQAHNPQALLALAQQQLRQGQAQAAASTARELLRTSPLQAQGLAILAKATAATGETAKAQRLFAIAMRRAPRDLSVRGWMIVTQLREGHYAKALRNVAVLFGVAPEVEQTLIPVLTRIARHDPAFATALGRFLVGYPPWRAAMLDDVLAHAPVATIDRVFVAASNGGHGLSDAEAEHWYARLEKAGRWGEAYGRWVSRLGIGAAGVLPLVYNGSFEQAVSGVGFGWSMRGEPGVQVARVRATGASGAWAAQVSFRRRRANAIGLGQTLLLAAGHYRLTFRAAARNLRSDKGLQWDIQCVDGGPSVASSQRLGTTFAWKTITVDFSVPATHCPAQQLTLVNPGAGGTGKVVSGILWLDDFRITPVP